MYLANPLEDVIPGARGRLLATIVQLEVPVTIRALARHAGVSPQTALTFDYREDANLEVDGSQSQDVF